MTERERNERWIIEINRGREMEREMGEGDTEREMKDA